MQALQKWLRQPTTVAGISAFLGTLVAVLLHQVGWTGAIPLMVGALTSMLLPDNRAAKTEAEALAAALLAQLKKETLK